MENGRYFLYPSTLLVCKRPAWITTILGSCVAVCLYDPVMKIGGMNHYMLPYWNGEGLASPKYGNIAINKLIKEMVKNGSKRLNLVAKIFGGANVSQVNHSIYYINKRNISVSVNLLKEYSIPIVNSSTGGNKGRRIQFCTETGKVLQKFIK
ncbi:MAG: chemotaxis protein CheD [Bacteroidales bacterium]|nr:MAG: chemotaxis protein CheD [Bacteroidales bacterium]